MFVIRLFKHIMQRSIFHNLFVLYKIREKLYDSHIFCSLKICELYNLFHIFCNSYINESDELCIKNNRMRKLKQSVSILFFGMILVGMTSCEVGLRTTNGRHRGWFQNRHRDAVIIIEKKDNHHHSNDNDNERH